MHGEEAEHVTGRWLDVAGGNLIMFRAEPRVNYAASRRASDHDMLDYVRAQEQKLKLENKS